MYYQKCHILREKSIWIRVLNSDNHLMKVVVMAQWVKCQSSKRTLVPLPSIRIITQAGWLAPVTFALYFIQFDMCVSSIIFSPRITIHSNLAKVNLSSHHGKEVMHLSSDYCCTSHCFAIEIFSRAIYFEIFSSKTRKHVVLILLGFWA